MLAFIDESGRPYPGDPVSRPVLLSLCVSERKVRDLARQIHGLKRDILGREDAEIKAHSLLREATFRRCPERKEFVEQVVEVIRNSELYLFAMIMTRPQRPLLNEPGHLSNHYRFLLERIHLCAEEKYPDEMALLVFDGVDEGHDWTIAQSINSYLFRHEEGRSYTKLVESPLFVNSRVTPGIQVADLAAGIVRIYKENDLRQTRKPANPFLAAVSRYYPILEACTLNLPNRQNHTCYGFYEIPDRTLIGQP